MTYLKMKVSEIFEEEPIQWGLRGDPYLWRELKERFDLIEMPSSSEELQTMIENEYEKSTGQAVSNPRRVSIDRFSGHGMSSGFISPAFWANTGIPLLISRHATS